MTKEKDISDSVKLLIVGYLQGTSTKKDLQHLKRWLDADDENKECFNQIKTSWMLAGKLSDKNRFNEERLWNKLQSKLSIREKKSVPEYYQSINFRQIIKVAATWLIIFLLGSSITYMITKQDTGPRTQKTIISSPLGAKSHVILPDGSSVWINAGSMLEYSGDFNSSMRKVKLTGEGFFEVVSNRSKPFVVNASDISIIAFGTTFNVKAYPEEKKVVTTLVEGEVKIEGTDNQKKPFALTMQPKQKVTYYADNKSHTTNQSESDEIKSDVKKDKVVSPVVPFSPIVKDTNVRTELYTSWKDKRWLIEGEKFGNLVIMLERRFNVSIILSSGELDACRFSGIIENETLEQVFEILHLTIPIEYSIDTGKVFVRLDRKLKEKYRSAYQ